MNTELLKDYKLVLGLEIHMHLKTNKKMFCGCDANFYNFEPNSHTCPVCLGLPGALPVPNKTAVKMTQILGLALDCRLNEESKFDRKHYSYPDLSKGYQISQYEEPLCEDGFLRLSSDEKIIIKRIHLEEDTAKSIHNGKRTLLDFNKSGVALVEIVTEPVFKSVEDVVEFSRKIQDIVRHIQISDADMEKGQMRLEANISLRTPEMERKNKLPEYKVEIKNINSFKFMEKAVNTEIKRQIEVFEGGKTPVQENRGYNEDEDVTVPQRGKEEAHDYRYFPEPDIPPMEFSEEYFDEITELIPELPSEVEQRLEEQYGISENNTQFFSSGSGLDLLEKFEDLCTENIEPEEIANLLKNRPKYRELSNEEFVEKVLEEKDKIEDEGELGGTVLSVIKENPEAASDYKQGKENAVEYLLGQVMRKTKGKAEPNTVRDLLIKNL